MRHVLGLALCAAVASAASADDWPQWMGPQRDNIWRETGILEKFPADGPKKLWSTPLAGGYAGPAVANGIVYITDYVTKDKVPEGNWDRATLTGIERVFALDQKTGKEIWKHEYPVKYTVSYPAGPRCTPTVDGDKVYTLGAEGHLICFEAKTGKIVWEKALKDEYKTKSALWGYAGHPLVDGKKLITLAGGDGSHIVALDKLTGKEIWRSQSQQEQGYVPPSIITAGGTRQLLMVGPRAIRGLNPETGERLWSEEYNADSGSVIMTPILYKEYLYFGGYRTKNILLKMETSKPAVTVEWRNKKDHGISAVNVQPILDDGVVYGFDESGKFYAVELPSGKRLWETTEIVGDAKGSETAFIVKNGDRYFFFTERGELVIGKLSKEKFTEIDRKKVIEPTGTAFGRKVVWCMPAFADRKMYVRNDQEIICIDLAK